MNRRAKPKKGKAEAKRRHARKSSKDAVGKVRDLEKRLEEALGQLQTRDRALTETLEQQTATGEVLRVITSSPTDLQPVLDTVAESAARLCEAVDSLIFLSDGQRLVRLAFHGRRPVSTSEDLPPPPDHTRDSVAGRAFLERRVVHAHDLLEMAGEFPDGYARAVASGDRTVLGVPLLREGQAIGVILIRRTEVRPFADKHIALLQTFADQAVIAIENARLFKELQTSNRELTTALDTQTATSDILRVISRSQTDVQPVFDAIVRSSARLLRAHSSSLQRIAGDQIELAAFTSTEERGDAAVQAFYPLSLHAEPLHAQMFRTQAPINIADVLTDPRWPEAARVIARIRGYQSWGVVPLLRHDETIGVIAVTRREPGGFTDDEIALLQTFADQAVIAIENVRLFKELQEKNQALTAAHSEMSETLERQTATAEILRVISSSPTEVQPVLDSVVESAVQLCGAYDARIWKLEGDRLVRASGTGPLTEVGRNWLPLDASVPSAQAFLERRTVQTEDVTASVVQSVADVARSIGIRSALATPLMREGKPIGVLTVRRREPGPFSDKHVGLLQTFAAQAVIAIENVRLFTELQEKNETLTQAYTQVTDALEQQTATSEILRVISNSPTDVQPIFDAIVNSASRLCGDEYAIVTRYDGQLLHLVAQCNPRPGTADETAGFFPQIPDRGTSFAARALVDAAVVHVTNVEDEDLGPMVRERYRRVRLRAVIAVPMMHEGRPIGVIGVSRGTPGPFSDRQIALLRTFAAQAVIAIENVRLFKELEVRNKALTESLEQQMATAAILRVISSSPTDLQPVMDAVAETAAHICGAADATIRLLEGDTLRLVAHFGSIPLGAPDVIPCSRDYPAGRSVIECRTIHIEDILPLLETEFPPIRADQRTVLATPLMRERRPIGVILIRRVEIRPFTDKQVALLQTFADQAVIAIENVRLFKELEVRNRDLTRALEQQTATSEILRVISNSPTDVQPVFDTIAERAWTLCSATVVAVYRFDGELIHLAAHHGFGRQALAAAHDMWPSPPHRGNAAARSIADAAIVHIPDFMGDAEYRDRQYPGALHVRAVLSVPMLRDGRPIGAVTVGRADPGPYSDKQVELLKTFADQAVIAIENVRLFREVEVRTQELTRSVDELRALGEVGQAISSTLDLQTVLGTIVARATQLSGTDAGVIYEYDDQREIFVPRATEQLESEIVETMLSTPVRKGEGATGQLAEAPRPVEVPDILAAPAESRVRGALVRAGYRALLAVPLLREGHLLGGLTVIRKAPGEFATEIIELLRTFATQSALAIQNARLFQEIEAKGREIQAASQHKSEFLANMSHELRTPLNAIIGYSELLEEEAQDRHQHAFLPDLEKINAAAKHQLSLINDILDLSKIEAGRMELELSDFDLPSTIDNALILVRERASRRSITLGRAIAVRVGTIRADERKVKQVLLNLLSNALKFTPEGGRIDVRAAMNQGLAEISVADTGVGIAPEDQEAIFEEFRQVGTADRKVEGTGLGLTLCRKFVELHGGRISVKSQEGQGSTFTFTLPVRDE